VHGLLALLDSRRTGREAGEPARPSLVVVPRSLVFNWIREAQRFTPNLRVLDYSGPGRRNRPLDSGDVDVVITTYGTLRRDAPELAAVRFDYAILDEAQAIKNAGSASAKSARLIVADHRIAMTGTPIENRIEELWSLFEFLNPGMLGAASAFSALAHDTSLDGREVLARSLRPVVLRRTKEQVAADLPARTEQTLSVELEPAQRRFYDGLLESYRRSVLERVDKFGVGRAKMHILEALLRLRQAACHPALVDPSLSEEASAKVDALLPALEEIIAQGHKALVFSQFTSFLALVRARLDAAGVVYEYLDGRVRDRQSREYRFSGTGRVIRQGPMAVALRFDQPPHLLRVVSVGVEHAHASRAHLLGLIVESLDVDDQTRQGVDDRTGRNRRRPDDGRDEPVGGVVRQNVALGVELGVGNDEGRPEALGDHAAAVRRVEDDGRMRRGIRHPHVLVE
jgi:hypothetical protein